MRYLATTFSVVLILVAVLLPGSSLPSLSLAGIDKLVHFSLFTMWTLAVMHDFEKRKWGWVLLAGIAFSVLTEFLQLVVEGRTFDTYDMLADAIGITFGLLTGQPVLRLIRKWTGF